MRTPNQTQGDLLLMSTSTKALKCFWVFFLDRVLKLVGRDLLKGRQYCVLHQLTGNKTKIICFWRIVIHFEYFPLIT